MKMKGGCRVVAMEAIAIGENEMCWSMGRGGSMRWESVQLNFREILNSLNTKLELDSVIYGFEIHVEVPY
ncbi:hypothetical protein KY285_021079 [Solanum tuberosum]|nr:hypothetical protein KY285_021079 [Solanum tuberosum]